MPAHTHKYIHTISTHIHTISTHTHIISTHIHKHNHTLSTHTYTQTNTDKHKHTRTPTQTRTHKPYIHTQRIKGLQSPVPSPPSPDRIQPPFGLPLSSAFIRILCVNTPMNRIQAYLWCLDSTALAVNFQLRVRHAFLAEPPKTWVSSYGKSKWLMGDGELREADWMVGLNMSSLWAEELAE